MRRARTHPGPGFRWIPPGPEHPDGEETEDRLPGELSPAGAGSHLVGQGFSLGGAINAVLKKLTW